MGVTPRDKIDPAILGHARRRIRNAEFAAIKIEKLSSGRRENSLSGGLEKTLTIILSKIVIYRRFLLKVVSTDARRSIRTGARQALSIKNQEQRSWLATLT
jgi:hypothetical protein